MTWHQIPFLRLLLPFMLGIVAETYIQIAAFSPRFLLFLFVFFLLWLAIGAFRKGLTWRPLMTWAVSEQVALLLLGALLTYRQDGRNADTHFSHFVSANMPMRYRVAITEPPQIKGLNTKLTLSVQAIALSDSLWQPVQGDLLATMPSDSHSMQLKYGDILLIRATARPISGAQNPYGLDLRNFYAIRGLYHQTYIGGEQWQKIDTLQGNWLWGNIYDLRAYLLTVFRQHCPTNNEYAVMSGLVLGVRDDMDKSVIQAYADVGAMHILSVSGLHVGLIAWLLLFIFERVPIKHRYWRYLKTTAVIVLIWLFALLTGCSPPALRSAAMFSFVSFGQLRDRKSSIYNSLASSAFFLLCYNPLWLWDAGFQLSYLALLGIVYYQPRIYKLYYPPNRLVEWAWNLTTVSIAASLTTFALGLYYFHQFSFSSFLSGLVALPIATALLPLGFMLLVLGKVPIVATVLGFVVYWLVWLLNASVFFFQAIPYLILQNVWLDTIQFWLLNAAVVAATLSFYWLRARELFYAQTAVLAFALLSAWQQYGQQTQKTVCIYQVYKGSAIGIFDGQQALTFADSATLQSNALVFAQKNHLAARNIRQNALHNIQQDTTISHEVGYYSPAQVLQIADFSCAFFSPTSLQNTASEPLSVDIIVIRDNVQPKAKAELLHQNFDFDHLIIDGSNSQRTAQRWQQYCDSLQIPYTNTAETGAFLHHY
jgi:competence protein ComEC